MTRRERLENRLEKRRDWAIGAEQKADVAYKRSQDLVAGIPFGQPILVGHHSENRHRRAVDGSWNAMGRSVGFTKLAEHHEQKAAGLEAALEKNIFSDDPDAVEAIEARIAANEAKRDLWKKVNVLYRKKDADGLANLGYKLETLETQLADAYSWAKMPFASYQLTNLGARIRTDKQRLEDVKRRQKQTAAAEEAPNGVTLAGTGDYVSVTFAEKPDRDILNALRGAGFHWSRGSWNGKRIVLPPEVLNLLNPTAEEAVTNAEQA